MYGCISALEDLLATFDNHVFDGAGQQVCRVPARMLGTYIGIIVILSGAEHPPHPLTLRLKPRRIGICIAGLLSALGRAPLPVCRLPSVTSALLKS